MQAATNASSAVSIFLMFLQPFSFMMVNKGYSLFNQCYVSGEQPVDIFPVKKQYQVTNRSDTEEDEVIACLGDAFVE
jgi:hypothetical protein